MNILFLSVLFQTNEAFTTQTTTSDFTETTRRTTPITAASSFALQPSTTTKALSTTSTSLSPRSRATTTTTRRPVKILKEGTVSKQQKLLGIKCFQVKIGSTKVKCFKISNALLAVSQQKSHKPKKLKNFSRFVETPSKVFATETKAILTTTTPNLSEATTKTTTTTTRKIPTTITTSKTTTTAHEILTTTTRSMRKEKKKMNLRRSENRRKESKVKNMSFSAVDCGDRVCSLRHQIVKDCTVYIHTNNSECVIPCLTTGCKREMHHFINCPIWECTSKTTTSLSPSTTTPSPFSPTTPNPIPQSGHLPLIISSVSLNVLFVFLVIGFIFYRKVRRQRRRRQRNQRNQHSLLLPNNDRYFTLGSESSEGNSPVPPALPTFPAGIPLNEFSAPLLNERNPDSSYFQDIDLGTPLRITPTPPPAPGPSTGFFHRGYSTFKTSPKQSESPATLEVETTL